MTVSLLREARKVLTKARRAEHAEWCRLNQAALTHQLRRRDYDRATLAFRAAKAHVERLEGVS